MAVAIFEGEIFGLGAGPEKDLVVNEHRCRRGFFVAVL
jgi:hypothetical protein